MTTQQSHWLRVGVVAFILLWLLTGCGARPPVITPPPPPTYTLIVHLFNGPPSEDHKIGGAEVAMAGRIGVTDATGNVNFVGLSAGTYTACAAPPGFGNACKDGAVPPGNSEITLSVTRLIPPLMRIVVGRTFTPRLVFASELYILSKPSEERKARLREVRELGFNGVRVFGGELGQVRQTPQSALRELPLFLQEALDEGLYVQIVAFTGTANWGSGTLAPNLAPVVMRNVNRLGFHDLNVLGPVVTSHSVNVMNNLFRLQRSTNFLLGDQNRVLDVVSARTGVFGHVDQSVAFMEAEPATPTISKPSCRLDSRCVESDETSPLTAVTNSDHVSTTAFTVGGRSKKVSFGSHFQEATVAQLESHLNTVATFCAAFVSCMGVEVANEPYHGSQSALLHRPDQLLALARRVLGRFDLPWALGASISDEVVNDAYEYAGGTFDTAHLDRGRDKWNMIRRLKEIWDIGNTTRKAVMSGEPIGAAEVSQPGRRESDPAIFFAMGVLCRGFDLGCVWHSEDGLNANPLGPVQTLCAVNFIQGTKVFNNNESYSFQNAGWATSPIKWADFDNGIVRAYSFVRGNEGFVVLLGVKGDPRLEFQGGWRATGIVDQRVGIQILSLVR